MQENKYSLATTTDATAQLRLPEQFYRLDLEIPPRVNPGTFNLLIDALKCGVDAELEDENRFLTYFYYGTDSSLGDLARYRGSKNPKGAMEGRLIIESLTILWASLPPNVRDKYDPDEVIVLKAPVRKGTTLSERTKSKMRQKHLGKKHSDETKWLMSKIHTGVKASAETRALLSRIRKGSVRGVPLERIPLSTGTELY
ncbi:MAG: NUMOD3 domain-containing DNA-binding protein [Patescibacteria group bacterium]